MSEIFIGGRLFLITTKRILYITATVTDAIIKICDAKNICNKTWLYFKASNDEMELYYVYVVINFAPLQLYSNLLIV